MVRLIHTILVGICLHALYMEVFATADICFNSPPTFPLCQCPGGQHLTANSDNTILNCMDCEAGRYSPEQNDHSSCNACSVGHYSGAGQELCDLCDPGSFADDTGMSSCTLCAAGKQTNTPASHSCENCTTGRYSDEGATECDPCEAGSFADTPGAGACKLCAAGTYAFHESMVACVDCARGRVSGEGQAECGTSIHSTTHFGARMSATLSMHAQIIAAKNVMVMTEISAHISNVCVAQMTANLVPLLRIWDLRRVNCAQQVSSHDLVSALSMGSSFLNNVPIARVSSTSERLDRLQPMSSWALRHRRCLCCLESM